MKVLWFRQFSFFPSQINKCLCISICLSFHILFVMICALVFCTPAQKITGYKWTSLDLHVQQTMTHTHPGVNYFRHLGLSGFVVWQKTWPMQAFTSKVISRWWSVNYLVQYTLHQTINSKFSLGKSRSILCTVIHTCRPAPKYQYPCLTVHVGLLSSLDDSKYCPLNCTLCLCVCTIHTTPRSFENLYNWFIIAWTCIHALYAKIYTVGL